MINGSKVAPSKTLSNDSFNPAYKFGLRKTVVF